MSPSATPRPGSSERTRAFWRRHLGAYLDEFVFRYNRRRNLGLAFRALLGYGATRGPTTWQTINGAQDLPKITYTPSLKERRRAKKKAAEKAAVAASDT